MTAIQLLKDKEPGTFVVRDSTSYRGSFGLAMKVPGSPSGTQTGTGARSGRWGWLRGLNQNEPSSYDAETSPKGSGHAWVGDAGSRIRACSSPPCASTGCGHPGDPGAGRGAAAALTPLLTLSSMSLEGEDSSELVRHFLIESSAKGVHLKGASEELYFGKDKELYFGKEGAIARSKPSPRGWGRALTLHHDGPRQLSCTLLPSPADLGMLLPEFAWVGDRWGTAPLMGSSVLLQGASPPSCTSTPSPRWRCPASSASPPEVSHRGTGCCRKGGWPSLDCFKQCWAPESLV